MVENTEYVPTLIEWDELVLLWNRSQALFSSTLAVGATPRIAWVTKNFIEKHPEAAHRAVYAWLTKNLEIARGSPLAADVKPTRWHDEPTAVHKLTSKGIPHEHITTSAVARGPRVDR